MPKYNSKLPLPEYYPETTRCIQLQIPDGDEYVHYLLGALSWLAFWDAYDRDIDKRGKDVAALWRKTIESLSSCAGGDTITAETIEYYCTIYNDECEGDEMSCIKPVKRGGIWYLPIDCGCDETLFLPLGTPALLDGDGNPIGGTGGVGGVSGSGDSGAWDFGGITGDPGDCYAAAATDYLLARANEYAAAVIDFATIGLDALSDLDEYIEIAALVSKLLFGTEDLPDIQAQSKSAVAAALADSATTTPLIAAWSYTGRITKSDLSAWVKNAPAIVGSVPVRIILQQWLIDSWLIGISRDLARIAAECESGNYLPSIPTLPSGAWLVKFDFTTDAHGWVAGRTPEEAAWGNWESTLGWGNAAGGGVQMHVSCTLREELDLIGMRVTLNEALPSSGYNILAYDDIDGTVIHNPSGVGAISQYDIELNQTVERIQTNIYRQDNGVNGYYITEILLWGTGDLPSTGEQIV